MNVLITGANRGLGLEFARQLAARGEAVLAGCRAPDAAQALRSLRVEAIALDVTDPASIERAHCSLAARAERLDLLVNNAGVFGPAGSERGPQRLGSLDGGEALRVMGVNLAGPMMVIERFADFMVRGSKIVNISSGYGSIARAAGGWPLYYCCSKAALNMLTRILAEQLRERGTSVVSLDPGWVATDMGGPSASLEPPESVAAMLRVIDGLSPADSGKFLNYRGQENPW